MADPFVEWARLLDCLRMAWVAWRRRERLRLNSEFVRAIAEMDTELANAHHFLRNENRQINEQMQRVMKHNIEIRKAFRFKMDRKARHARRVSIGLANEALRAECERLSKENRILLMECTCQ